VDIQSASQPLQKNEKPAYSTLVQDYSLLAKSNLKAVKWSFNTCIRCRCGYITDLWFLPVSQRVMSCWQSISNINWRTYHVRLAYQPPASSTFLSEQTSHHQPANSTFLSEQISTSHQPPAKRTVCIPSMHGIASIVRASRQFAYHLALPASMSPSWLRSTAPDALVCESNQWPKSSTWTC
jgi:hypothetical protein